MLRFREAHLKSFDGTRLVYRVYGEAGPWLVIANGYGGTFNAWDEILPQLTPRFRVLLWDYRGMHRSALPDRAALRIVDHIGDLRVLLDAEGIDRCVLAGWSIGVQVALEGWRQLPDRVRGLMLLNGAHDRILKRAYGGGVITRRAMRPLTHVIGAVVGRSLPRVRPLAQRIARSRVALFGANVVGAVRGKPNTFADAAASILELDFGIYTHMIRLADEHETEHWLGDIDVPVLIAAGTHDQLTPPAVAERAVDLIPNARYRLFDGGTHYTLMEFPREMAETMIGFMDDCRDTPE